MASIDTMLGLIGKLESPYITVHQERCALVRNRHADCLRCAESCASGCISYDGEVLTVSPEKCIGCGTCATMPHLCSGGPPPERRRSCGGGPRIARGQRGRGLSRLRRAIGAGARPLR